MEQREAQPTQTRAWAAICIAMLPLYVLSSGPMLGIAFRLREATGWNAFYAVIWLYYPLLLLGHGNPIDAYIDWWVVHVFHTVGPG